MKMIINDLDWVLLRLIVIIKIKDIASSRILDPAFELDVYDAVRRRFLDAVQKSEIVLRPEDWIREQTSICAADWNRAHQLKTKPPKRKRRGPPRKRKAYHLTSNLPYITL